MYNIYFFRSTNGIFFYVIKTYFAVLKYFIADLVDAFRKVDGCQTGATHEQITLQFGDSAGDGDFGEAGASLKSRVANFQDAVGDGDGCQARTL